MWLLLDTGNSSTKAGLFDPNEKAGGALLSFRRFANGIDVQSELRDFIGDTPIERAGGVSVVPTQTTAWSTLVEQQCGLKVEYFNESSGLPFDLTYETPQTMGNDRIAVAAGGWVRFGGKGKTGVIVVDAGTAINYEIIRSNGEYPGGVIAPGPDLIRKALGLGTAQLPQVAFDAPKSRIGRSTDEAIRSGIMYGMLDSVRSMVEHIQAEERQRLGPMASMPYTVVLTGGWGKWLSEQTGYPFEDHLVLKGLADLMRISAG